MACGCEEYLKPFSNKPLKEGNLQDHHLPFAVVNATRAYFRDMDSLGQFKTEVLDETKNGDDKLEISKVFATYQRWCRGNSLDEKSKNAVGRRLSELGLTRTSTGLDRCYVGVKFAAGWENAWRADLPDRKPDPQD